MREEARDEGGRRGPQRGRRRRRPRQRARRRAGPGHVMAKDVTVTPEIADGGTGAAPRGMTAGDDVAVLGTACRLKRP